MKTKKKNLKFLKEELAVKIMRSYKSKLLYSIKKY
jgi:hypothetical protein